MASTAENNKRIAKNTAMLYIRMLLIMAVTLYTSRVVLEVLGVEDFGIYNVIGGVVSMLAFFTSSLSNATQRFLSIQLGRENIVEARKVFNQSLFLYLGITCIILLLAETIGLWFVSEKLVISPEREFAAQCVYQFSLLNILLSILQVPYISAIIARERMSFYAYLGIFDVVSRLLVVYMLLYIQHYDHLILYAGTLSIVQIVLSLIYIAYCRIHFPECRLLGFWNWELVRSISKFIGYNLFGCFAWSAGVQGTNIVLNLFFGPTVNAARAISVQVNAAVVRFTESITTAIKPQIIKSYALGDREYMFRLLEYSSKFGFIFMLIISMPILFYTDYILKLWLVNVPEYASIFVQLMIVESLIGVFIPPLWIMANATGNIKRSQVYGRIFTLAAFPISYVILRFDIVDSPIVVFVVLIFMQIGYWLYSVYDIHLQLGLNLLDYFRKTILPIIGVLIVTIFVLLFVAEFLEDKIFDIFLFVLFSTILIIVTAYSIVMNSKERRYVISQIRINLCKCF